jgi:hypothetical protein
MLRAALLLNSKQTLHFDLHSGNYAWIEFDLIAKVKDVIAYTLVRPRFLLCMFDWGRTSTSVEEFKERMKVIGLGKGNTRRQILKERAYYKLFIQFYLQVRIIENIESERKFDVSNPSNEFILDLMLAWDTLSVLYELAQYIDRSVDEATQTIIYNNGSPRLCEAISLDFVAVKTSIDRLFTLLYNHPVNSRIPNFFNIIDNEITLLFQQYPNSSIILEKERQRRSQEVSMKVDE